MTGAQVTARRGGAARRAPREGPARWSGRSWGCPATQGSSWATAQMTPKEVRDAQILLAASYGQVPSVPVQNQCFDVCWDWQNKGFCPRGDACRWAHSQLPGCEPAPEQKKVTLSVTETVRKPKVECSLESIPEVDEETPVEEKPMRKLVDHASSLLSSKESNDLSIYIVSTPDELEESIRAIYEHGVEAPEDVDRVCDLLVDIRGRWPSVARSEGPPVSYTRLVLGVCKQNYDALPRALMEPARLNKCNDFAEAAAEMVYTSAKYHGNVSMIAHLYLRKLLSIRIIETVVRELLCLDEPSAKPQLHHVEVVCQLLRTTGATLESVPAGFDLLERCMTRLQTAAADIRCGAVVAPTVRSLVNFREAGWMCA
mmetsp:Transcript_21565/g.55174  ORF Transcript_21565/g.55174 Transcript_21565/m.55174 type:complete len:371 (+) Transcript_21565:57-1169(+)